MHFFSVIIPVYNKGKYVARCIQSILSQTFIDFQIVIVNDGSIDNSRSIIESIHDPRIILVNTENRGVSSARNTGINHCDGKYLIFVDADDEISKDYLYDIYAELERYMFPQLLVGGLTKIKKDSLWEIKPYRVGLLTQDELRQVFVQEMQNHEGLLGYVANKTIARDTVISNAICFRKELRLAEDLDFWLQAYSIVPTIAFCDVCGYLYYQNMEYSSVFSKHVDYIQQLYIWSRMLKFVNPTNAEFLQWFDERFSGYVSSVFNDLDEVTLDNVRELCQKVDEHSKKTTYSLQKSYLVNRVYALGSPLLLYLYLKIREISHSIR